MLRRKFFIAIAVFALGLSFAANYTIKPLILGSNDLSNFKIILIQGGNNGVCKMRGQFVNNEALVDTETACFRLKKGTGLAVIDSTWGLSFLPVNIENGVLTIFFFREFPLIFVKG